LVKVPFNRPATEVAPTPWNLINPSDAQS